MREALLERYERAFLWLPSKTTTVRLTQPGTEGDFGRIVEGVNQTLDSVIGPLQVAAGYVDRSARERFRKESR